MSCIIDTHEILILGIPPYIFFAGLGFVAAMGYYLLAIAQTGHSVNKNGIVMLLSLIGLFAGAVGFGFLTKAAIAIYNGIPMSKEYFSSTGIVFYGGLTGLIITFLCLQKLFNKKIHLEIVNILAVAIPLFHCFARIGCFFAGCCYGKAINTIISVNYIPADQSTASLTIPVQLIEACINLLIFITLLVWSRKNIKSNLLIGYLFIYSVCRFLLEFLRGDAARGEFGILSFSQIYSILIIMGISIFTILRRVKQNENS